MRDADFGVSIAIEREAARRRPSSRSRGKSEITSLRFNGEPRAPEASRAGETRLGVNERTSGDHEFFTILSGSSSVVDIVRPRPRPRAEQCPRQHGVRLDRHVKKAKSFRF
jgi:hypothetical protein